MQLPFYKYQGTGNDFILVDQRQQQYLSPTNQELIEHLCHRRFGIGADGLILLENEPNYDFRMVYFNADGRQSSMCGNGGRCIVAFAKFLGVIEEHCRFLAIDGPHEAVIQQDDWVELKMSDVQEVETDDGFYFLNTGSPHYVRFVENLEQLDVVQQGRAVRYSDRFRQEGTNVNFVQANAEGIAVATYERGVEDETLSCGTGVTAAALAYSLQQNGIQEVPIQAKGGNLLVRFQRTETGFEDIWLCGPAKQVFEGRISV